MIRAAKDAANAVGLRGRPRGPAHCTPAETLDRIRAYNLEGHSDEALRSIISLSTRNAAAWGMDCLLPLVFAVLDQAIRRRLGIWRIFDADFNPPPLAKRRSIAGAIMERGSYRANADYYVGDGYLDGPAFCRAVEADPAMAGLDADDRAIVRWMVYAAEKVQRTEASNIMMPGSFYRSLRRKGITEETQFSTTDEQITAGCLLFEGSIVEMAAGEGKTVSAAFPAVLHAVLGRSVHVVTANDYLASRDAELLAPVYESLGLTVRAVLTQMNDAERAYSYSGNVVYGTLRELGFDFLRDNLKHSEDAMVQGPLDVAIVDEADQAMIDEAHTPIIISGSGRRRVRRVLRVRSVISDLVESQKMIVSTLRRRMDENPMDLTSAAALYLADPSNQALTSRMTGDPRLSRHIRALASDRAGGGRGPIAEGLLYVVDRRDEAVSLTTLGRERVEAALGPVFDTADLEGRLDRLRDRYDLPISDRRNRAEYLRRRLSGQYELMDQVNRALHAEVLLSRDVDYVVSDGSVVLIDGVTGRRRPDSRYQHGLQAAVEAKEGVPIIEEGDALAQLPVQGFFEQYRTLCGLTGTAADAAEDFHFLYGLDVAAVPPSLPSQRTDYPVRLYRSASEKHRSLVEQVEVCRRAGRPVLIGAATVEQSSEISALLAERGIAHNTLDANSLDDEERIVADAGRAGAVTVAANVAGRGTDIVLEPGLDDRIAHGYVSMIDEHLAEGYRTVSLACGSPEEMRVLRKALDRRGDLAQRVDAGNSVISVSRAARTPGDGTIGEIRVEAGLGLYVIGAELGHASRTDRQLRGRSGRQGQPGGSRFILSLQDRLLTSNPRAVSAPRRESHRDGAGRLYYEGPHTSRGVRHAQAAAEIDDHAVLKARRDLNRIIERQTAAYYRTRRWVMRSADFRAACLRLARECAGRLVDRHLGAGYPQSYAARFERLSETLWLDYRINGQEVWGLGPEQSKSVLSELMEERVRQSSNGMPLQDFEQQAKSLMLRTSDAAWSEHLVQVNGLIAGIQAAAPGHAEAVSDFGRRSVETYRIFSEEAADRFVQELLTGGVSEAETQPTPELKLVEDAEQILV